MQSVIDELKKYSPLIAGIVGAGNPIANLLLGALGAVFGSGTGSNSTLAQAIADDPLAKSKIAEFELKHEEILAQYSQENYATEVEDRKDARLATIDKIKVIGKADFVQQFCAITIVLGFFAVCFAIAFTKLDTTDHDIFYVLIGILGTNFNNVYGFYFGASKPK